MFPAVLSTRLLVWLGVMALSLAPASQAPHPTSFSATLTSIKVNARPGQVITRQFQLTMDRDQARTHFRAKVEDWWRSEDGQQSFYREPGTLRHSCAPWASVNPVDSAVGAGETLTVRITVALPVELAPGGYWCALTVDEVPDPLASTSGVGVRFVASVSTGIFLYVDPVERNATILGLRVDGDRAVVRVRNDGNAPLGIEGHVQFFVPGAALPTVVLNLARATLLTEPSVEGEISVALPSPAVLAPGRYLVRAILDIGAAHDIGAEREIEVTRSGQTNGPVR
jgi:hypothetical protein